MNFCDSSTVLTIIMYLKYILLFLLLFLLIFISICKRKNIDFRLIKKILKIIILVFIIYIIVVFTLNIFNLSIKSCINNSNPIKLKLYKSLTKTYKDKTYLNVNSYLDKISSTSTMQAHGSGKINIYNQNEFPISEYRFSLTPSLNDTSMKKSGNEILILSSLLSGFNIGDDTNPLEILSILQANGVVNYDIGVFLQVLSTNYDFFYKQINFNEIYNAIKNNGYVIAKVHGNQAGEIFTCTDSYILIYNVDSNNNYKIITTTDRSYEFICPINTKGFGNVIDSDLHSKTYYLSTLIENADAFYLVWR